MLRRQHGGWALARVAWRLGCYSLEVDMDVVQFDVLKCTHRILETILNLRHCRVTSKVSRLL